MRKPVLLAVAAVLLLTGCRAEANISLVVEEDGSGSVGAQFGLDEELLALLEQTGGSAEDIFGVDPDGEDVETSVEGDMTFYAMTRPFADEAGLDAALAELDGSDSEFVEFELEVDGEGGAKLLAAVEVPNAGEAAESLSGVEITDEMFSANVYVDLPGTLETSNADEILPDGRLRWRLPFDGGRIEMEAITTGDSGGGVPWLLIVAIALIAVIAAAVWVNRRKPTASDAIAAIPAPETPQPIFDAGTGTGTEDEHPAAGQGTETGPVSPG